MNSYSFHQTQDNGRRFQGIAFVGLLHVVLAWALISGTAQRGLALLKVPMKTQVIQEVSIAPPPPPPAPVPPPKQAVRAPVKAEPPPFVPPAEVPAPPATTPAIEASATPPKLAPVIAPPAPVAAEAVPAMAPSAPAKRDMALVCPTQVAPEMPRKALIDGTQGVVRAQAVIEDGVVREVNILSGPRVFYAAVKSAMLKYKCSRESGIVMATQDFNFKFE